MGWTAPSALEVVWTASSALEVVSGAAPSIIVEVVPDVFPVDVEVVLVKVLPSNLLVVVPTRMTP